MSARYDEEMASGSSLLLEGRFHESIAAFDRAVVAVPERTTHQWKRGISCYLAGEFEVILRNNHARARDSAFIIKMACDECRRGSTLARCSAFSRCWPVSPLAATYLWAARVAR